ncbi:DUF6578 domain-containing protein [Streptomyces sp. NPDC005236]|uniref:DUF6578 domain-containing protein n=1 Tax=Streptomyces sp. NPDC005236 TaxID=3157028 RepID=UPI0033BEEE5D
MGRWWVFYADWQMECCGTPFSVGDEVNWPLLLGDADDVLGGGWSRELSEIAATVEHVHDDGAVIPVLRADDGLSAVVPGGDGDESEGRGRGKGKNKSRGGGRQGRADDRDGAGTGSGRRAGRTGLLTVERHGARWPGTTGTVRSIHLVHQDLTVTGPGPHALVPAPASRSLEAVDRCPRWFGRGCAGVVAELDVPGPRT